MTNSYSPEFVRSSYNKFIILGVSIWCLKFIYRDTDEDHRRVHRACELTPTNILHITAEAVVTSMQPISWMNLVLTTHPLVFSL